MAYRTVTVQSLVNRVKFHLLGSGQTDTALDTDIQWALNSRLQELAASTDLAAFRAEGYIALVKSVKDYLLPDDFDRMIDPGVKFSGDPNHTLTWFDHQDYDRVHGDAYFTSEAEPRWYTIRGRDKETGLFVLRIMPTSDAAYLVKFTYMSMPDDLASAALTDYLDKRFPPEMIECLVFGAVLLFPQYVSRDQLTLFSALFEDAKRKVMQLGQPVTGRIHQNRRYTAFAPGPSNAVDAFDSHDDILSV